MSSIKKIGLPPGSVIYTGSKNTSLEIEIIEYNKDFFVQKTITLKELLEYKKQKNSKLWINFIGVNNIDEIKEIGKKYNISSLILEDIVNINQRPAIIDEKDYFYFVFKMISYTTKKTIDYEQVSLIVGKDYLISFQEKKGDVFELIRNRIKEDPPGRLKKNNIDYLCYALIDVIIDNYFLVFENIGNFIEEYQEKILINPDTKLLSVINKMKRDIILIRKAVWPLREAVNKILKKEVKNINDDTIIYFRDVYDHIIISIDNIETSRDMISGLMDIYLSTASNKLNEIMKVLTIFSAIFIPLTFIAGVYGMNFKYMPELEWKLGYLFVWGVIISLATVMILFFKKKKWL